MTATPTSDTHPHVHLSDPPAVSIIVPARNEEVSLPDCLNSLVSQKDVSFEIIVVDDHSSDHTHEIASSFSDNGVRVIAAPALPMVGPAKTMPSSPQQKSRVANGSSLPTRIPSIFRVLWLARLRKPSRIDADLLSYSPEQIAVTFWEMADPAGRSSRN